MRRIKTALLLCLVWGAAATADSPGPPPAGPYHEVQAGLGADAEGAFMLISWTGKRRLGVYLKAHLLDDDEPIRANSTVVEESAGGAGVTLRVQRHVTVGAGYGVFERDISVYGDPTIFFGIPELLEEREERETGIAGLIIVTPGGGAREKLGWSFAISGGPTGVGASIQFVLRSGK